MKTLVNGENCACAGRDLVITTGASEPVDLSAVLCAADGRVRGDADFVFYNQPQAPGVQLTASGLNIRLDAVDPQIDKIVLLASLDGTRSSAFGASAGLRADFVLDGQALASFVPAGLTQESAVALVEVYRRAGSWKIRAVGQGWGDGLAGAARTYGIDVTPQEPAPASTGAPSEPAAAPSNGPFSPPQPAPLAAPVPLATPSPAPQPSSRPTLTPATPVSEPDPASASIGAPAGAHRARSAPDRAGGSQSAVASGAVVSLDKPGASRRISLEKTAGPASLHINLNWHQGGFLNKIDLDLGCFVETTDGRKTCIQALGKSFGSATQWPWVHLDKDDRSGRATDGENLVIHRPDQIARVLVFAMIYAGSRDFTSADAVVTITDLHGGKTRVPLIDPPRGGRWCAVAMVRQAPGGVEIVREEQYFRGHAEADRRYDFGFRWKAGRK